MYRWSLFNVGRSKALFALFGTLWHNRYLTLQQKNILER